MYSWSPSQQGTLLETKPIFPLDPSIVAIFSALEESERIWPRFGGD